MAWYHNICLIAVFCLITESSVDAQNKVYIFLGETCPLSQYYTLPLKKLHTDYASDTVAFIGVFPSQLSTATTIVAFQKKYGLPFACLLDTDHTYVDRFGITVTPEVVVVDTSGIPIYRGRIDNTYAQLGKRRRIVTEHDLDSVLRAITSGRTVAYHQTRAIGCFITALSHEQPE